MEKWADFVFSKEKWILNSNIIESFIVHLNYVDTIGEELERKRSWVTD